MPYYNGAAGGKRHGNIFKGVQPWYFASGPINMYLEDTTYWEISCISDRIFTRYEYHTLRFETCQYHDAKRRPNENQANWPWYLLGDFILIEK